MRSASHMTSYPLCACDVFIFRRRVLARKREKDEEGTGTLRGQSRPQHHSEEQLAERGVTVDTEQCWRGNELQNRRCET